MRISKTSLFLSALMLAAVPIGTAGPAQAQSSAVDEWGLTAQDWLRMNGPSLRATAGIPGSLSTIRAAAERGDAKQPPYWAVPLSWEPVLRKTMPKPSAGLPVRRQWFALRLFLARCDV
ncbi:hypothetical protein [Sphingopyxis sp.]|uniref:hypothetical protein n=1 Tax=Sphingopyxis sp. TaxID=1908224 RepID=UPI002B497102|nr:hypothetical protein [Sphingopyxis sp.]HJS11637.1 hypothetical protein [Sphingopyxis sp.]